MKNENLLTYRQHLKALLADFNERLHNILNMNIQNFGFDSFSNLDTRESQNYKE